MYVYVIYTWIAHIYVRVSYRRNEDIWTRGGHLNRWTWAKGLRAAGMVRRGVHYLQEASGNFALLVSRSSTMEIQLALWKCFSYPVLQTDPFPCRHRQPPGVLSCFMEIDCVGDDDACVE